MVEASTSGSTNAGKQTEDDKKEDASSKTKQKLQPSNSTTSFSFSSRSNSSSFDLAIENSLIDPLDYEPVKAHWFYTEVGKRKKKKSNAREASPSWRPFNINDSNRLEERWAQLQASNNGAKQSFFKEKKTNKKGAKNYIVSTDGGLYDVNLQLLQRTPVYWKDEHFRVRRCTWFYKKDGHRKFEPYDEATSEKLENYYKSCSLTSDWIKRYHLAPNELLVINGPNLFIHYDECPKEEWLSIAENPYSSRQVNRGTEGIFNLEKGEIYDERQEDLVDHLVFFVHGVGGLCDTRFRSIIEVVADFRRLANNILSESSKESQSPISRLKNTITRSNLSSISSPAAVGGEQQAKDSETNSNQESQRKMPRRVEFLPIYWHSVVRKETGVNEQLKLVTESHVPVFRQWVINKLILDSLLYSFGPIHSQTIINTVAIEINRLYSVFMERHPSFTGSISLAGHSLGSIILFDLLANQILPSAEQPCDSSVPQSIHVSSANYNQEYDDLDELLKDLDILEFSDQFKLQKVNLDNLIHLTDIDLKEMRLPIGPRRKLCTYINFKRVIYQPVQTKNAQGINNKDVSRLNSKTGMWLIDFPQLSFKPRCLFIFGSPITMFLAARGVAEISPHYKLPTCDRLFNIYHPYDPLGYRIEPYIDARFKNVEPVLVPHKGGKRIHVQLREGFARVGSDIKNCIMGSLKSTWSSFNRFTSSSQVPASSKFEDTEEEPTSPISKSFFKLPHSLSMNINKSKVNIEAEVDITKKRKQFVRSRSDLAVKSTDDALSRAKTDRSGSSSSTDQMLRESDEEDLELIESPPGLASEKIGCLNGGQRIDYRLQEKPYEYVLTDYIFACSSHASYWSNEDSAMMILNEIYRPDNIQLFEQDYE